MVRARRNQKDPEERVKLTKRLFDVVDGMD